MGAAVVLRLYNEQARWGQFEELEQLLIRCQIAFDRHNEGKYEISPERFSYRPGSDGVAYQTNAQERIVVEAEPLEKLVDQLAEARRAVRLHDSRLALRKLAAISRAVRRHLPRRLPPLTSLEIVPSRRRTTWIRWLEHLTTTSPAPWERCSRTTQWVGRARPPARSRVLRRRLS